jgi:hypothetical protein
VITHVRAIRLHHLPSSPIPQHREPVLFIFVDFGLLSPSFAINRVVSKLLGFRLGEHFL